MEKNSYEYKIPHSWSPATYLIEVLGELEASWTDRLGGMRISSRKMEDRSVVTTLKGRLKDQAELTGVLNSLYNMHFPLLRVQKMHDTEKEEPEKS